MSLLIAGVLFFCGVHLFTAVAPGARTSLIGKLGNNPYRGLYSLAVVAGLVLIVFGWRQAGIELVYVPPLFGSPLVTALVFVAFYLFAAAHAPGNTKRFLRHPMLTGTIVWGVAHLLANGDSRSVVLFGGLSLWAALEIMLINRRDGAYSKPPPVPVAKDLMTIVATAVVFAVMLFLHRYLFGVSPLPGM